MVLFRPALALSFLLGALAPVQAVTVKIMPLGDSLTAGPGCWRALVWQRLQNESVTNTDFVGSQTSSCAFPFDGEHEGHGGYSAMSIVRDNQLPGWLASTTPDMVTVMLGTNDAFSTLPALTVLAAFDTLVDQMRASKSTMRILIAQIPPSNPSGCAAPCYTLQAVIDFNNALAAWAPGKSTTASPITIVDCWTGFVQPDDFVDGIHPSDSGTQKLANCWYGPMKAAILGFGSLPTTSSSASRTTTTSVRTTSSVQKTSSTATSSSRTMTTTSSTQKTSSSTTSSSRTMTTSAGGAGLWSQCGGLSWEGPTTCATGTCTFVNTWYSQCLL